MIIQKQKTTQYSTPSPRILPRAGLLLFVFSFFQFLRQATPPHSSIPSFKLDERLSNKELSHVLGDNYIQGAEISVERPFQDAIHEPLEGWSQLPALTSLTSISHNLPEELKNKFLNLKKEIQTIPQELQGLWLNGRYDDKNHLKVSTFAQKIGNKVKDLKANESLWLEGGWTKSPSGHAMFYQFKKKTDGTYDIYIYNTGAGLQYHYKKKGQTEDPTLRGTTDPTILEFSGLEQTNYCPFVKFKGVLPKEIFGSSSIDGYLFEKLISLKIETYLENPEEEIYINLFGALNHRRIEDPRTEEDFFLVTPQKSGTCAWRVLAYAALRMKLGEAQESESALIEKRHSTFKERCYDSRKGLDGGQKELCIQAGRELLRGLAKYYDVFLSEQEISTRQRPLLEFLDFVENTPSLSSGVEKAQSLSFIGEPKVLTLQNNQIPRPPLDKHTITPPSSFSSQPIQVTKMKDLIEELKKIKEFQKNGQSIDMQMQIEKLVKALPLPSQFATSWSKANLLEIQECQALFAEVLSLYKLSIQHSAGRLLTEQNTAWAVLAAVHHLSARINPELRSTYGIAYDSFKELIDSPTFTAFRKEDLAFYTDIVSYFEELPQSNRLFSLATINSNVMGEQDPLSVDEHFLIKTANNHPKISSNLRTLAGKHSSKIPLKLRERAVLLSNIELFKREAKTAYLSHLRLAAYEAQSLNYEMVSPENREELINLAVYKNIPVINQFFAKNKEKTTRSLLPASPPYFHSSFQTPLFENHEKYCLLQSKSKDNENLAILNTISPPEPTKKHSWQHEQIHLRKLPIRLETTTCQKTLQSARLIQYFTENILDLSKPATQNLFKISLFSAVSSSLPLEESIKNPDFISQVSEFVQKGLSIFGEGQKRPDIHTCLFFVETVRRLKELDLNLELPDLTPKINEWLALNDLTEDEKKSLHFHKILQYGLQKKNLLQLTKEEIAKSKELKEILMGWIRTKHSKVDSWGAAHMQSEVTHLIYELAPVFERLPHSFLKDLIQDLFPEKSTRFSDAEFSQNTKAPLHYTYEGVDGVWSITPLQGKVFSNGNELQFGNDYDTYKAFTYVSRYSHVFGDKKFPFINDGTAFLFQEQGQNFRIFLNHKETRTSSLYDHLIIQMQFEGKWYECIFGYNDLDREELASFSKETPKPLIVNHLVFHSGSETLFVNKETFQVDFRNFEGLVENSQEDFLSAVEQFEENSWILKRAAQDGSFQIQFPRFRSLEGNPLAFSANAEGISWNDNSQFTLKQPTAGLLGLCSNFLLLQKEGETKLLVPVKPLDSSKEFEPHCHLDLKDEFRQIEYQGNKPYELPLYTGELSSPQYGRYPYLEYSIKEGIPTPLNTEGALFLSYLFLGQKDYKRALDILTTDLNLKEHTSLSQTSNEILQWIIERPLSSHDRSSSAAALALRATFFRLKSLAGPERTSSPPLENNEKTKIYKLWSAYEEGIDEVSSGLRLSEMELKKFKELALSLSITLYPEPVNPWLVAKKELTGVGPNLRISEFLKDLLDSIHRSGSYSPSFKRFNEAKEAYESFRLAKTKEQKTFLKMKFFHFLTAEENKSFSAAMVAVMNEEGSAFTPFPKDANDFDEWAYQFKKYKGISSHLMPTREVSETSSLIEPFFASQSMAEALHKARASKQPSSFELSAPKCNQSHFLEQLEKTSFTTIASPKRPYLLPKNFLTKKEIPSLYKSSIEKERADFVLEYQKGIEKNQNETQFALQSGQTIEAVHLELKNRLEPVTLQLNALKDNILKLANRAPENPTQAHLTLLLTKGKALSEVQLDQLILSFLEGSSQKYLSLNPHLKEEEINKIDALLFEFLTLGIEKMQIERGLQEQDPNELGHIILAKTSYAAPEYEMFRRQFLVYEYRADLKMREDQAYLIAKMSEVSEKGTYKNFVTQMMMGGGKTSVLAVNILYLSAKPGRIAFYIPPATQFSTLKENLGNSLKKYFGLELVPVKFSRPELTIDNLLWLKTEFEEAEKFSKKILLTTRETIEALNCEHRTLLHQKNKSELENDRLEVLSFLVKKIRSVGDLLADEGDLLLNPLFETNFPIGGKTPVEPTLIDLTRQIFKLLNSPEFASQLSLKENNQASLSESERKKILFNVSKRFIDEYKDLHLSEGEKEAFLHFVLNQGDQKSFETLLALRSQNETMKDSVEKMSLIKHQFTDVLPLTLGKSTGEHYGRVLTEDAVGPYNGVANPSFTEFGSEWEAINYHFQTALSKGITTSQVDAFVKSLKISAIQEVLKKRMILDETKEAKILKKLTGFSFSELEKAENLELATLKINETPEYQLFLEANTIATLVGFYAKYASSTSQNFIENFATFRFFSGTTWTTETLPTSMQDNYYPDIGTEGKIADVLLERADPNRIHLSTKATVQDTLKDVLEGMDPSRKKRLSGFIDSSGLFKDTNGYFVAKAVLEFYAEDPRIQTVLFFGRASPRSPMTLMALKKGSSKAIVIGSTQKEEIAKHNIERESTFVYYDQPHCEATDILQPKDAINIISVNHKMIRRTFMQGILRLRQYFKGQDIEIVIPQNEKEHFTERTEDRITHADILLKVIDNQAIRKADITFRSYKQKIDHVLTQVSLDELLKSSTQEEAETLLEQYEPFLISKTTADLYSQFGTADIAINSLQALQEYREQKERLFMRYTTDQTILSKVKDRLNAVIDSALSCPYLPTKANKPKEDRLETQIEISLDRAKEQELSQDKEQELSLELQQELELYQAGFSDKAFVDLPWTAKLVEMGFTTTQYDSLKTDSPKIYSLQALLKNPTSFKYARHYFELFDENILVSSNFVHTSQELRPVFAKEQKQADQILLIKKEGKMQAVLLSSLEGAFFKEFIERTGPSDMWLVLPSGKSYVAPYLKMSPQELLEKNNLLWQIRLFNGDVESLLKDETTEERIERLDKQLLHFFLELKVANDPSQKALFYQNFKKSDKENLIRYISF